MSSLPVTMPTRPFRKLTPEEHANSRKRDYNIVIDAVFLFAD